MMRPRTLFPAAALLILVACGGGSHPSEAPQSPATSLTYTNPSASPSEWKLERDASSTGTRLVLNLVGPSDGTKYRGIGFTLLADNAKVAYGRFQAAAGQSKEFYKDGGVFLDKTPAGGDMVPSLQVSGVRDGKLMAGIFQKTDDGVWSLERGSLYDGATAKPCQSAVMQVALELDPALKALPGDVSLKILKARVIPEIVNSVATRRMQEAVIKVGVLTLK